MNFFNKKNLGATLVGLGLIVLFFRMTGISITSFWPLLLVALGIYQIRNGGDRKQAQIFIGIGAFFAAFTLKIFALLGNIWPIAFVLAGVYFLTKNIDNAAANNVNNTLESVGRGVSRLFKVGTRTIRNTVTDRQGASNRQGTSNMNMAATRNETQVVDIDIDSGLPNGNTEVEAQSPKDPGISSTVMFSSNKLLPDKINNGGSSTCLFGDLKIDLRDVKEAPEKVKLDLTCGFGDVRLQVPQEWRVELRSSSFFADVSNEARTLDTPTTTLQVQANAFFGDINITN